jgi:hypothetical protein
MTSVIEAAAIFHTSTPAATVHLAHVGVPEYDHNGVTLGWKK